MTDLAFTFHVAQAAYPGFSLEEAGDSHVIAPFDDGILVAGIDGLGHGPKAAEVAATAADALRQDPSRPVQWQLEHCNRMLRGSRGAAVSIASINTATLQLEWAGVGNVTGMMVRSRGKKRETLVGQGGVVGFRMPNIRAIQLPVGPDDTLILTSDGIRSGFMEDAPLPRSPQQLADHILEHYKRDTDDAMVVVVSLFSHNGAM